MLDLDRKVFGGITTKEVIGADPPAARLREMLEEELAGMVAGLGRQDADGLGSLLRRHAEAHAHVNGRPGAMALAQDKIRLFNEFGGRYADAIRALL